MTLTRQQSIRAMNRRMEERDSKIERWSKKELFKNKKLAPNHLSLINEIKEGLRKLGFVR